MRRRNRILSLDIFWNNIWRYGCYLSLCPGVCVCVCVCVWESNVDVYVNVCDSAVIYRVHLTNYGYPVSFMLIECFSCHHYLWKWSPHSMSSVQLSCWCEYVAESGSGRGGCRNRERERERDCTSEEKKDYFLVQCPMLFACYQNGNDHYSHKCK